ncbi:MAG: hypothetical protein F4X93_00785 [Proteobacteria bacterium]|nr:hypothetical protein [Pseudomonadota bacterium]
MANVRLVQTEERLATKQKYKVLFLGYNEAKTLLIHFLLKSNCKVWHTEQLIHDVSEYDLVISFGYRHILSPKVLATAKRPIINLHIGYLPYNRGTHPNFWAFYDGTPSGVTIHFLDEDIDTGDILFQRYVNFDNGEVTFEDTYARLVCEVETLFKENLNAILNNELMPFKQRGNGTYHNAEDLPTQFSGWTSNIAEEIARLDQSDAAISNEKLLLIDEIETVRRSNNVNWMDLLRLAFAKAPNEAKKIIRRINSDDNKISELFKKLGE